MQDVPYRMVLNITVPNMANKYAKFITNSIKLKKFYDRKMRKL